MTVVDEYSTDIKLDDLGQPIVNSNGDFMTVSNDDCWKQDLKLEAETEEGELFYEDEDGTDRYGFGLMEFNHAENDEFVETEIKQRCKAKLEKRAYLDPMKTKQSVSYDKGKGIFTNYLSVAKENSNDEYNIELTTDKVEVIEE